MTLLKAVLKALSESYPSDWAMDAMESLGLRSLSPASNMRQWVRYSIGESPTVCLNLRANVERDMPARSASVCSVQRCAGASCMALIAMLICGSARA